MRTLNTTVNLLTLSLVIALSTAAHAQSKSSNGAAKPGAVAKDEDKKVDISDLENKYWAPKDTDFSVVQNRTYSKEHKFFFSPVWGMPINDAHSEGNLGGFDLNYFWSERYGVQFTALKANLHNNQSTNDLVNFGSGVQPDHSRMDEYIGFGFNYVPFYAKMSFLGKKIIYFDMAITPTIGMTKYDEILRDSTPTQTSLTYGIDITQYFFFSKWFAIRADLKNQWYSQDVLKYYNTSGVAKEGDKVSSKMYHDSLFLIGATFFW